MRDALLQKIRWGVIRTQSVPVLRTFYQKTSQVVTREIGRKLAKMPGAEAVFLRHSRPNLPGFIAGHSDLDLTLVFNDKDAENPERIRACYEELERLTYKYPFIQIQDARFASQRELTQFLKEFPSPSELLYQPEDWFLVAGEDIRNGISRSLPTCHIPWHPEFNKWWENIIQHHSFSKKDDLEKGYMRTLYRCALKNQVTLQAAMGIPVPKPNGFIDDELTGVGFDDNQDLKNILTDLGKRNFWEEYPEAMKARILFWVFLSAEDFFGKWQAHPAIQEESNIHSRSAEEPHCSVYRELECKIKSHTEIHPVLKAAVAYPVPYSYPYSYSVYLVLREGLSLGEFAKGTRAVERCFGRREFKVGQYNIQITLIPESIYKHPLFFLGLPYPFLPEHIREFGATVYGSPTTHGVLSRDDLALWCRLYLPYHMFNLRRRPQHNSPALSFYQLAGIRIFLECGDKLTDGHRVRETYLERFGNRNRDRDVLDYFLHGNRKQLDVEMYHDTFVFLSDEYDRVESILTECNRAKS